MVLKGNKKISLTEREYDTAKNILKDFPNKDLEKQVKESETENQKNQLGVPSAYGEFVSIRKLPLISHVILNNNEYYQNNSKKPVGQ